MAQFKEKNIRIVKNVYIYFSMHNLIYYKYNIN